MNSRSVDWRSAGTSQGQRLGVVCLRFSMTCSPEVREVAARSPPIRPRPNHNSDLNIGSVLASLPDVLRYEVRYRTGWFGVGIQLLGDVVSFLLCADASHVRERERERERESVCVCGEGGGADGQTDRCPPKIRQS